MDINDVIKEIEKLRKKNHELSNLVMVHNYRLDEIPKISEDVASIKTDVACILNSLSGGLEGEGFINRIAELEKGAKATKYWLRAIGVALLTVIGNIAVDNFPRIRKDTVSTYSHDMLRPENKLEVKQEKPK